MRLNSSRPAPSSLRAQSVAGRLDAQFIGIAERQDLIPVLRMQGGVATRFGFPCLFPCLFAKEAAQVIAHLVRGLGRIHVEQHDDVALPIGDRRGRIHATRECRSEIAETVRVGNELVPFPVVTAEQVLTVRWLKISNMCRLPIGQK